MASIASVMKSTSSSSGSSWVTTWIIFSKVVAWMMLITAAWMRFWTIWFCLELAMISVRSVFRRSISERRRFRIACCMSMTPGPWTRGSDIGSASSAWFSKKSGWAFR